MGLLDSVLEDPVATGCLLTAIASRAARPPPAASSGQQPSCLGEPRSDNSAECIRIRNHFVLVQTATLAFLQGPLESGSVSSCLRGSLLPHMEF